MKKEETERGLEKVAVRRFWGEGGGFFVGGRKFLPHQQKEARAFEDGYNLAVKRALKIIDSPHDH